MIILGLGSNVGNRLAHLRDTLNKLKHIAGLTVQQASPVYLSDAMLPDQAPESWNLPFLNCAAACTTTLSPEQLLAEIKKIEAEMGRQPGVFWGPRVIDVDILAWDNDDLHSEQLTIPHASLTERPFALWPLADLMPLWLHPRLQQSAEQLIEPWGSRYSGDAPYHTRQINQRIDSPALVGIINVTPDSFSDGGQFYSAEQALRQAVHLMEAGAEILDIGAESTAPNREPLTPDLEWQRLAPVLSAIMQAKQSFVVPPLISVDTRHAAVAEQALAQNIDWLNDVTGFEDADMRAIARSATVDCVVMHHLSIPPTKEKILARDQDPVTTLINWCEQKVAQLTNDGISPERIILDPGFGFGKSPGQALTLLQQMHRFTALTTRILVGHSRKSFMASFTPRPAPERDLETMLIAEHLNRQQVDYLRVHRVDLCARAFRVQALFRS